MKRIIIIGAGIAGLSAAIYARRGGYDVSVFEAHSLPGGMCTAWKRKGFTIEGCLHYIQIVGSASAHMFHGMWKELGIVPDLKMYHSAVFHTFSDTQGRTLTMYADADRLEGELLRLSPDDAKEIRILCASIRHYSWFVRSVGINPFLWAVKLANILAGIRLLNRYGGMNLAQYTERFRDPLIRKALAELFVYPDFAYPQLCFYLAGHHLHATGYPEGGSLAFARRMEQTLLSLGGSIRYRQPVKRILVENGRAVGVELADGAIERADTVISAADGHTTLVEMLGDAHTTLELRARYQMKPLYHSFVQVSLGIARDLSGTPHAAKVAVREPFEIAGRMREEIWHQHTAFDPTMAPQGKTTLTILYPSELSWWETVGYQTEAYKAEKRRILDTTVRQLERIFPGIGEQIEVTDVATPYTMVRYTHNWKGALGFIMTQELSAEMTMNTKYSLPGLEGFWMAGQWVKGFGVPTAAMSGKEVVEAIRKADRSSSPHR